MKTPPYTISIPTILAVGKDHLSNIGKIIKRTPFLNVVVFFGQGIKNMFGDSVVKSLKEHSINILETYEYDNIEINNIIHMAFNIPTKTDAIIGIGGGKVLDAAKYMCFLNNLPFISVPTSTSNDGFSSSGCSLIIEGKRTSVSAKMPYGIILDLEIIKNCPPKFIFSGIGDLISKITALHDWEFEEKHNKAVVNDFAAMIASKAVISFIREERTDIKNEQFLEELVNSLTMNGISMEIAGNSAPASGSEHLISHALDKIVETPQLHGTQVGIATYLMSIVQNNNHEQIAAFLKKIGFFDHAKELGIKASDFQKAIDIAPSIKPHRYTYIHVEKYRNMAKKLLCENEILKEILCRD